MTTRIWVKLYLEILDDPKMGRLSNHQWRRAVELFLLAGREGNDGALPPAEEMAWTLRLPEEKVLEDLRGLAEVGVVHEGGAGQWMVLAIRNILCSNRWKQEWPRIEARLRQQSRLRKTRLHQARILSTQPTPSGRVPEIDAKLVESLSKQLEQQNMPKNPKSNPWRNFKVGKALYQPSNSRKK